MTADIRTAPLQDRMHGSEAAHAEAQARLLLRPPSPGQSAGGSGLLGVLDFRSFTAAGDFIQRKSVQHFVQQWDH